MLLFALVVAMLAVGLGAALAFYFIMRARAAVWPPPGTPPLPAVGLWISTALLLATSAALHTAVRAARADRQPRLRMLLVTTAVLAVGFLISQGWNWLTALSADLAPGLNLYAATFYLLTALHAAHIVGGLVPLGIVLARGFHGRYRPTMLQGLQFCAWYWHFLDVVWLLMLFALFLRVG